MFLLLKLAVAAGAAAVIAVEVVHMLAPLAKAIAALGG